MEKYRKRRIMKDLLRAVYAPIKDPCALLDQIKAHAVEQNIPEKDAMWFYTKMQLEGWKFGGVPVDNWKEFMISCNTHGFFPSQRCQKQKCRKQSPPKEK